MMKRLLTAFTLLALGATAAVAADAQPEFHQDVAPILREYCAGCHNPEELDGDFSLETFDALMSGIEGTPVLKPGNAKESLFIQVLTGEADSSMPPRREPQPSKEQIAILQAWVNAGAPGPKPGESRSVLGEMKFPEIAARADVRRPITAAAISPDGNRMALGRFQSVEILDAKTHKPTREIPGLPGKVNSIEFSRDGKLLVIASGITGLKGEASLWEVASGKHVMAFKDGHADILYDAALSPDGALLATAGYDQKIVVWNTKSGKQIRTIEGHNGAIFDLAFSPDGAVIASASADETAKLWLVSTGERLDTLNQPQGEQFSVAFTPDGEHVLSAGADNRIRLWRWTSREKAKINPLVHARFAHEDAIVRLAVATDGKWLVSSSADHTLKLWTLPNLQQVKVRGDQPDVAAALFVMPGAKQVIAARMDGSMDDWKLPELTGANAATESSHADEAHPNMAAMVKTEPKPFKDTEPNNTPEQAKKIQLPARIDGAIDSAGDSDLFRFHAEAGAEWVFEVEAARKKSPLDSKLEILDTDGKPLERVVLQALRDSWFTFRGKDSDTSGDFRLHNWREMELNEYLYANGEVVKLWLYPRGPDSGFNVYPGFGKRHTYFGTTALAHPLGEPCFIVRPFPPGTEPSPNGLPVFRLYYENDDHPQRRWGSDSQILFTAPATADYLVRIGDVRGFGDRDYSYQLTVRPRQPDFRIKITGQNPAVSPGSGREFGLEVERLDGFDGEIRVDLSGLPKGFTASSSVVIQEGQFRAWGVIHASEDAPKPSAEEAKQSKLTATATIRGEPVKRELGSLGTIAVGKPAKILVKVLPDGDSGKPVAEEGRPLELTLAPGETITARVQATRVDFKNRIELGKEDSGRNLPHGVYVDNIGLNGLLIVEGSTERQFFITAADWVPETTRSFHLRATADGGQASAPVILHIKRNTPVLSAK